MEMLPRPETHRVDVELAHELDKSQSWSFVRLLLLAGLGLNLSVEEQAHRLLQRKVRRLVVPTNTNQSWRDDGKSWTYGEANDARSHEGSAYGTTESSPGTGRTYSGVESRRATLSRAYFVSTS